MLPDPAVSENSRSDAVVVFFEIQTQVSDEQNVWCFHIEVLRKSRKLRKKQSIFVSLILALKSCLSRTSKIDSILIYFDNLTFFSVKISLISSIKRPNASFSLREEKFKTSPFASILASVTFLFLKLQKRLLYLIYRKKRSRSLIKCKFWFFHPGVHLRKKFLEAEEFEKAYSIRNTKTCGSNYSKHAIFLLTLGNQALFFSVTTVLIPYVKFLIKRVLFA